MADSKTIADVYKEHEKSFLEHLKSAKDPDEEKIHKLRVEVKKLRTLFKFLEVLSKKKFRKEKVMKLISPVFKSAGRIRTAHLNLELIKDYRSVSLLGFKIYLKEKEKQGEKQFSEELKNFDKEKFKKLNKKILKDFKNTDQKLINKDSEEYINGRFSKINKDLPDLSNDNSFHDVRKKLKDVKTITSLLEDITPKAKSAVSKKNIETIEEKIGKWHDEVILVQQLEKFISENKSESSQPSEIKKNKDNEKTTMLVLSLKANNEIKKKLIAQQLKKKLF